MSPRSLPPPPAPVAPPSSGPAGEDLIHSQAGNLFRFMSSELQKRLFANVARMMAGMPREIQLRQICDIFRAEPAFGVGLATALGFAVSREPIRVRSL